MKAFKRFAALLIAAMMVLGTIVPAMAEGEATTPASDSTTTVTAPTGNGSITINSPIMGAQYFAYKVFKMTMNDAKTAYSYAIGKDDPFFDAVWGYTDKGTKHLILTGIESTRIASSGDIQGPGQDGLLRHGGIHLWKHPGYPLTAHTDHGRLAHCAGG